MEKVKRNEVADFWDNAVKEWLNSTDDDWLKRLRGSDDKDDLTKWFKSYNGALELSDGLEAFAGDLRGIKDEPRLVSLGLNPGVGYCELTSREGVWSKRIRNEGYSYCLTRGPATDPVEWLSVRAKYGKGESPYWVKLINFVERWLPDPKAKVCDILNFELYPWHSESLTAGIETPASLVERYIFGPIAEIDVSYVFAFGAPRFRVATRLKQERMLKEIRARHKVLGASDRSRWEMGLYELPSKQILVVSSQLGYAGPPGELRMETFRRVLNSATGRAG